MVKQLFILTVTLVSLSVSTLWAIGGCEYDTQGKGDRMCEKGVCVSPANKEVPAADRHWITDQRTKCRVWNPDPVPNESIKWSGACKNGLAEGHGRLEWFDNGKSQEVDQGEWHNGKRNGHGVATYANGAQYEGD